MYFYIHYAERDGDFLYIRTMKFQCKNNHASEILEDNRTEGYLSSHLKSREDPEMEIKRRFQIVQLRRNMLEMDGKDLNMTYKINLNQKYWGRLRTYLGLTINRHGLVATTTQLKEAVGKNVNKVPCHPCGLPKSEWERCAGGNGCPQRLYMKCEAYTGEKRVNKYAFTTLNWKPWC